MTPDPQRAGFDPARLAALVAALRRQVEAGRLPGTVFHVERRGIVAVFESLGVAGSARATPMRPDAIFRIYSMTKPVVSVALMQFFEAARVRLDDPVARYLPEFAKTMHLIERDGVETIVARAMTVQDLLRHTAELTYRVLAAVCCTPPLHPGQPLLARPQQRRAHRRVGRLAFAARARQRLGIQPRHRCGRPPGRGACRSAAWRASARIGVRAAGHSRYRLSRAARSP